MLATHILDQHAGLGLFQIQHDLRLGEPRFLHTSLLVLVCQKALFLTCPPIGKAYELTSGKDPLIIVAALYTSNDVAVGEVCSWISCRSAKPSYLALEILSSQVPLSRMASAKMA